MDGHFLLLCEQQWHDDPPEIALEKPAEPLFTAAGPVLITWKDSDPDSNADIALYL